MLRRFATRNLFKKPCVFNPLLTYKTWSRVHDSNDNRGHRIIGSLSQIVHVQLEGIVIDSPIVLHNIQLI